MVGQNNHDRKGQRIISMSDLGFVPPTVNGVTEQSDGLTLETIEDDPDKNIEMYFDDREMHLSGNPPDSE